MPSVSGVAFSDLEQHAEMLILDSVPVPVPVPVLGLEGLLKTQQGMRPKDQADEVVVICTEEAERAHGEGLVESSEPMTRSEGD